MVAWLEMCDGWKSKSYAYAFPVEENDQLGSDLKFKD